MKDNKLDFEKIVTGIAFMFFLLVTCYKLTNAPLWFDETIEYWYSKIMFGELPFIGRAGRSTNMYQRIVSTFQPPLYNFIMHFWLKILDTEWWFRLFGVVMGFLGNIGIYKAVKKTSNGCIAALAVVFASCISSLVYYWQECAEYCLMLGTLCWTIYFWMCFLEKQSLRNMILFIISAILPVYSQYGAAFPVIALLIIAYLYMLSKKDRKGIIQISAAYAAALVTTALPLFFFFLKKQIEHQQKGSVSIRALSFPDGLFKDLWGNFVVVFKWNLFSYYSDKFAKIIAAVFLISLLAVFLLSAKVCIRLLIAANLITWFLYYFSVKTAVYSYGRFGTRYNVFFIPLWVITFFCLAKEIYEILESRLPERIQGVKYHYLGICLCAVFCFAYFAWTSKLQDNWSKEDMRGAVQEWLEQNTNHSETLVYYGGDSGFSYYLRHYSGYDTSLEDHVTYMDWYRDKTEEEYTEYVNSIYGNTEEWPSELYLIGSHTRDDYDTLVNVFAKEGYECEDLYSSRAFLTKLTRADQE